MSNARYSGPVSLPLPVAGLADRPHFGADGLIPAVCQHAATGQVLMVAYQNAETFELTRTTGLATFWSRSRQKIWIKGEESGNQLHVQSIRLDCDGDTVLLGVQPDGPACHTGERTCFGGDSGGIVDRLAELLAARRGADPESSYTARLLHGAREGVARKVGEEATEVLLAPAGSDDLVGEVADLWFHSALLLVYDGRDPREVLLELSKRFGA